MIASVVAAIVVTGVYMVFMAETRLYHEQAGKRAAQSNARTAFAFMSHVIEQGGYGIDPDRAFLAYDGFDTATTEASDDGPHYQVDYPDAITVQERDPMFRRSANVDTGTHTIAITPALTSKLYQGQILLAICPSTNHYAYLTVSAPTTSTDDSISYEAPSAAAAVESPISAPGTWFQESASDPCFASGAVLLKVDRYSFYVDAFDGGTPYLMLNRGLDLSGNSDGTPDGTIDEKDSTPLASGIEQMQVAYVMNSFPATAYQPACGPDPTVFGVAPPAATPAADPPQGVAWAAAYTAPDAGSGKGPWWQALPYADPQRCTDYPGNLRQIRISLVATGNKVQNLPGDDVFENADGGTMKNGDWAWRTMENLAPGAAPAPFNPTGGGYTRFVLRQSIVPPNLMIRAMFAPSTPGGG